MIISELNEIYDIVVFFKELILKARQRDIRRSVETYHLALPLEE